MPIAEVSRVTPTAPMRRRSGDVAIIKTPATALVPLEPAARTRPTASLGLTRPDPRFVAHLIAIAHQSPQTRTLRRAATSDVQAAYRSADQSLANQNQRASSAIGARMRLTA